MDYFGNITLRLGDCMEFLPTLPDKSFDLAIVDPPYFSGPERRQYYGKPLSRTGVRRVEYPVTAKWDVPQKEYFNELLRVSRFYIVWGCNYYDYMFPSSGRIIWDKCNHQSSFSDCEIAATNLFNSVRLFPYMWNGMCQGKSINEGRVMQGNKKLNEKRIHPTQKPVALYSWILSNFAKEGWKILDTHLGSGSLAVACYGQGFSLLGIEIEKVYYKAAVDRLLDIKKQELALW